jgi:uncharacterized DUF497 family protein
MVKFEWDERKNKINIEKHGIDFRDAQDIFQSRRLSFEDKRKEYREKRILTVGLIGKSVCVVVYTIRDNAIRLISARKANERERRRYYERTKETET